MRCILAAVCLLGSFTLFVHAEPKVIEIEPADLVKLEENDLTDAARKAIHDKYDGKLVRWKGRAKVPVKAPTAGIGFIVAAEGGTKVQAMVFAAPRRSNFIGIEADLDAGYESLVVIEGIGQFPGELNMPAIVGGKVISRERAPRK